jgi:Flp pilus assembly protein TadG
MTTAMLKLKAMLKDECGQALALTALGMTMLLAFMALALDTGTLFRAKRRLQIAADAAAVAGTLDYLYNGSTTTAAAAAKAASAQNGYTDGSNGVSVSVSDPPTDGPNSGNAAFYEAVVTKPIPTTFMGIAGFSTVTVGARAVAGVPTAGSACIWIMANSGTAFDLQGSYDIEATGCGIYVNSPSSNALSVTGNGGTLNAKFLDVVGSSTSIHATQPTAPTLDAAPRKNPWGNLTGPTPSNGGCTTTDTTTTSITGSVTGPGLNKAICYTKAVTLNGATLGAGTYTFENGVTISGTVTVNSGTIDIYSGTFNQPSNTLLNITAPTSGTYNGIALLQTATDTNDLQVQFGSNNQTLDGYIFALGAEVYLQDHGGGITATGIVAKTMYDKASVIRIPSYDVAHPSTTPNRVVTLTE